MTPANVGSAINSDQMRCQICHARPARPDGAICWVCLGSQQDDPLPVARALEKKTKATLLEPEKSKAESAPLDSAPTATESSRQNMDELQSNLLLLDFSDHLELLEKIRRLASFCIRTPEQQIFWTIKMFPETDRDSFNDA